MNTGLSGWAQAQRPTTKSCACSLFNLSIIAAVFVLHGLLLFFILHSPSQYPADQPRDKLVTAMLLSDGSVSSTSPVVSEPSRREVVQAPAQQISKSRPVQETSPQPTVTDTQAVLPKSRPAQESTSQKKSNAPPLKTSATAPISPAQADASSPLQTNPVLSGNESLAGQAVVEPGTSCPKPEYPKASRRSSEEGVVTLRFLIDTDGQVLKSEISKSSGFDRLDEAARQALSKCKFRPGMENGRAIQSWSGIRYVWRLK